MSLDKFLNMKPRVANQKMEIENPERHADLPWVEKYRPNKLEELTYQEEVTGSLKNILKTGNVAHIDTKMPHLLFYGPAGTGKTSAIIALSKELFGPKFYKERVLELNASDERGIGVIREKVKQFAQKMYVKNTDKNYLCPNLKVIILDEADLMTTDAQSALRRVIEDNSATTRFCIICNYITKIIEPLSSRCIKFRFKPIPFEAQLLKLRTIATNEGVSLQEDQIRGLLERGDLRQSINSLQSFNKIKVIPRELLPVEQSFGEQIIRGIKQSHSIHEVYELGREINAAGYASDELLSSLLGSVLRGKMQERKKGMMLERLSKAEESLMLGATELPMVEVLTSLFYIVNLEI